MNLNNRTFEFDDILNYLSNKEEDSSTIDLREALVYWENQNNFKKLMDIVFPNRELFLGEIIDFYSLDTTKLGFERNIYNDFDDILEVERKSYVADNKDKTSFEISICYELKRVNH